MRKNFKNKKRVLALALACSMAFAEMAAPIPAALAAVEGTVAAKPGTVTNLRFDTKVNGILDTSKLSWDAVQGAERYQIRITDAQGREYINGVTSVKDQFVVDDEWGDDYYNGHFGDWTYKYVPKYLNVYSLEYDLDTLLGQYLRAYAFDPANPNSYPNIAKDIYNNEYKILNGGTYSIQIRAVNSKIGYNGYDYDDDYDDDYNNVETAYGDWSAPVTYTMPKVSAPSDITNIKLEDGRLSYNLAKEDYAAVIKIVDAANREYFADYTMVDGQRKFNYAKIYGTSVALTESNFSYVETYIPDPSDLSGSRIIPLTEKDANGVEKNVTPFRVGATYAISIAAVNNTTGEDVIGKWSAPMTYTVADKTVPEATGNIKYESAYNRVTWNSVKDIDGYKVEIRDQYNTVYGYSKDNLDNYVPYRTSGSSYLDTSYKESYDWHDDYRGYNLDATGNVPLIKDEYGYVYGVDFWKDAAGNNAYPFKPGSTYTVTVSTYNTNAAGVKLFSAPVSVTFTVPTVQVPQVKNLYVANGGMRWDAVDNNNVDKYQCEIKDSEGRVYVSRTPDRDYNEDGSFKGYNWEDTYANVGRHYYDDDDEDYYYTSYQNLSSVYAYRYIEDKDAAGNVLDYIREVHPTTGEYIKAFEKGKTYTVRVRAVKYDDNKREYIYGAWSDTVTTTIDNKFTPEGINKAPAKVTGFYIETDGEKVSTPTIYWNGIDNVAGYELEIVDSKGNVYTEYPHYINHAYVTNYIDIGGGRSSENSYLLRDLSGYNSYILKAGSAWDTVKNAAGEDATTFEPGETYKIRMRAYNTYQVWDANKQAWSAKDYYYGAWSNTVTYKVGKSSAITGLKYVKYENDYYRFTYNATINNSTIYYQVATDNKFNAASVVLDWTSYNVGSDLLIIDKDDLEPGKTYFVRAVNYPNGAKDFGSLKPAEIAALKPAVAQFKTIAKATPKNITNLKLYNEDESYYYFRFNAVLDSDNGDYYELQASTDQRNWGIVTNGTSIGKSNINEGTTYIRAIAYVWQHNDATGKDEKVYGKASNVVTIKKSNATTSAGKLSLKSKTENAFTFAFSGNVAKDQTLIVEVSDSKNFDTNAKSHTFFDYYSNRVNKEFTLYYSEFVPGRTYYVRARVYNGNAKSTAAKYSAYTNVISVKTVMPEVSVWTHAATKNSITIAASAASYVTGYEFQKQNGKNWVDLARQAGNTYTDTKLKADTTYTYRVRPYFFNTDTKKTTYGSWVYTDGTTWVGSLNPIAKAAGKKAVKLTWSAVSGAKGYEIYRLVGSNSTTKITNGMSNSSSQWKQIKTLSAKAKSYTDKDVTANMSYSYKVVAYKTIGGKKVIIDESAYVDLSFGIYTISSVKKSNGKVTWTWNPVYSAKGYLVEKKDNDTGKWSTYKNIKKASTSSITLPKTTDVNGVTYRVRAYNGKKYTTSASITVYPVLATPSGVKAKANAKTGAITVSWKKVSGADYYRVYRTTDSRVVYNADLKGYTPYGLEEVTLYVADKTKVTGYKAITKEDDLKEYYKKGALKLVDREITKTIDGITSVVKDGPKTGVKYYYYVVAYKNGVAYQYVDNYDDTTSSLYSKQVSATLNVTAPKTAAKISSVKAAKGKVTVAYKKIKGVDGYDIYRSTNSKKGFEVVGTVGKETTLKYVDKNSKKNVIKKGKTYYYKVRGFVYDDAGNKVYGKFSAVKKVKAK